MTDEVILGHSLRKGLGLRKSQTLVLGCGNGHYSFDQKSLSSLKSQDFDADIKKIYFSFFSSGFVGS